MLSALLLCGIDTAVVGPVEAIDMCAGRRGTGERVEETALAPPPELQAIQDEMIREQWEGRLDTRVPALGNKTPRQAARTVRGRERLEALLAEFDRHAAEDLRASPRTSPESAPRLDSQSRCDDAAIGSIDYLGSRFRSCEINHRGGAPRI